MYTDPSTPAATSQQQLPMKSWYGVSDPAERRKRQNRLNQRAHRRRKQEELNNGDHQPSNSLLSSQSHIATTQSTQDPIQSPSSSMSVYCPAETRWLNHPSPEKRQILLRQLAVYHNSFILNSPTSGHLFTLTRVNVHRAFVTNMVTLGISWDLISNDNAISPFAFLHPRPSNSSTLILPASLQPTPLQQTQIHHAWIDLFPYPVMRDNLLKRGHDWDDEELCTDIMGFREGNATGPNSLIVWGEPGEPGNWEVTEGFLGRWGWVVEGCEEVRRATDFWRVRRGEEPLFRGVVDVI
ncbi:hypothetical protein BDV12DRAFT_210161 [Aspergillus spectabilis]